jgi:EmrB/QacA subfamily drug resistance transporter
MVLGFFMILVDSTIVSVATPAIMEGLGAGVNEVIWVTSAYLLAYAVPLLITGRLGDRLGPRNLYLGGLAVFTLASLWCGLTGSIGWLIIARVVQGLGAAMLTPQTMAVITRTFPAAARGQAMALWGATAGVAILVGPIVGGVLVDGPGWEWIFFINVPVGVIGLVLAARLVPRLPTHTHSFDWIGVALSAVGMFLLVFGVQEGETYDWGTISGPISVPLIIGVGVAVLVVFVWWQGRNRREPLVPLGLFRDRNFSVANIAITTVGCSITAMGFPFMLYAQVVRGLSPTESALLLAPMAVLSGALAPVSGRLTDRLHPRWLAPFGVAGTAASLYWVSRVMTPDSAVWELLVPMGLMGIANAFMWGPLGATATRNLPMHSAGAGAGIYNTTRQVGAVLGSAGIATLIDARLAAYLPGMGSSDQVQHLGAALPPRVADGFAAAMSDAMLLPALVLVVGVVATIFFVAPSHRRP